MLQRHAPLAVVLAYTLLCGVAWADPPPPAAAPASEPDMGFLEFLGSVDGLAEVNPNYLAQARLAAQHPLPPPKPPPTPPPPGAPQGNNNE